MASAKSVSTSAQKLDALITQMKNTVKQYKNAPEQDKPKFVSALKQMNMKKRQLEQEVEQSIASLDHDAELKVTADMEEMKRLIYGFVINEIKKLDLKEYASVDDEIKFNKPNVKRYNKKQAFLSDKGKVKRVASNGYQVLVDKDTLIFVAFRDVIK